MSTGRSAPPGDSPTGLEGLAGNSDMRAVITAADRGDHVSQLALAVYLHRLRADVGAMAAAMDGLDALIFTGGVGERSPRICSDAVAGLAFLGLRVDEARNGDSSTDADISADAAPVRTLVIAAREDLEITRQVREVLARGR
jgi:acetate kinase